MGTMDHWDIILLVVAGYLAMATLSRLMAGHRDRRVSQLRTQIKQEKRLKKKQQKPQRQQRAAA